MLNSDGQYPTSMAVTKSGSMTKCHLGIKMSIELFRILWQNACENRIFDLFIKYLILPSHHDSLHIFK